MAPFLFIVVLDHALRLAISGREEELGFMLVPRQRRRVRPVMITDLDFADDITLISYQTQRRRRGIYCWLWRANARRLVFSLMPKRRR